jgi:hypothetical protein
VVVALAALAGCGTSNKTASGGSSRTTQGGQPGEVDLRARRPRGPAPRRPELHVHATEHGNLQLRVHPPPGSGMAGTLTVS